jgi:hypothetical protein
MTMLASKTLNQFGKVQPWKKKFSAFLGLAMFCAALPAALHAQTFQTIPSLYFTKAYAGGDPLSQVIGVASTGTDFSFTGSAVSLTGGSWLTIDNVGGCCQSTPYALVVNAHPDITLATGTYTGQITVTGSNNATMTIPVMLPSRHFSLCDCFEGDFTQW